MLTSVGTWWCYRELVDWSVFRRVADGSDGASERWHAVIDQAAQMCHHLM